MIGTLRAMLKSFPAMPGSACAVAAMPLHAEEAAAAAAGQRWLVVSGANLKAGLAVAVGGMVVGGGATWAAPACAARFIQAQHFRVASHRPKNWRRHA
jgi:hypothetical protein